MQYFTTSPIVDKEEINHEYLPVLGLESFSAAATSMLLGDNSQAVKVPTNQKFIPK